MEDPIIELIKKTTCQKCRAHNVLCGCWITDICDKCSNYKIGCTCMTEVVDLIHKSKDDMNDTDSWKLSLVLTIEEAYDLLMNLEQCHSEGYLKYGDPSYSLFKKLQDSVTKTQPNP